MEYRSHVAGKSEKNRLGDDKRRANSEDGRANSC